MNRIISEENAKGILELLDSVSGDCYMGKEWEKERVAIIRSALRNSTLAPAVDLSELEKFEVEVNGDVGYVVWLEDVKALQPTSGQVGEVIEALKKKIHDSYRLAVELNSGDNRAAKEVFISIAEKWAIEALRIQPQAPVCTRCKDPIKVGVCENCAPEVEPQAPVVEVPSVDLEAFEDIKKWAMTVTAVNPWDLCKLIDNALLQSKWRR